jgi:hypothetical protein
MEPKQIDAVAMTRHIRDAHAEQLKDATPEERIRFFREKASRVHAALADQMSVAASGTTKPGRRRS